MCASAINMTPDKRFIYITNRLESHPKGDAIVWFMVSSDGRNLERMGELRTGLDHPRAAEIFEYDGRNYYIVGSKTEMGAVVYFIDMENGNLKEIARNADVLSPSGFVAV
jgi:6-phosphogluconolactonase (cycloisomerase 2 family)